MELSDSFEVDHPIDTVWGVLTDVERIAPCLPGAQLTGSDGDEYQGLIKVKVGPITSQYTGKASFTERDDDARRLLMSASGRDSRGAGNASAAITVQLESLTDSSTRVSVDTDLTITGKVAQFGRGVLVDVSRKLMAQFAGNLASLIAADAASPAAPAEPDAPAPTPDTASAQPDPGSGAADGGVPEPQAEAAGAEVEAVDLLEVAGASVLKRLIPAVVVVVVVIVIIVVAVAA